MDTTIICYVGHRTIHLIKNELLMNSLLQSGITLLEVVDNLVNNKSMLKTVFDIKASHSIKPCIYYDSVLNELNWKFFLLVHFLIHYSFINSNN